MPDFIPKTNECNNTVGRKMYKTNPHSKAV